MEQVVEILHYGRYKVFLHAQYRWPGDTWSQRPIFIRIASFQVQGFHYEGKTGMGLFYLYDINPNIGKMASTSSEAMVLAYLARNIPVSALEE